MKRCPFCAEEVQDAAVICRFCNADLIAGSRNTYTRAPSGGVAAVLSLVIPGAGQMYKGDVGAGILWLLFVVVGYAFFIVPGLILHLCCVLNAASVSRARSQLVAPAPAVAPPQPATLEPELALAGPLPDKVAQPKRVFLNTKTLLITGIVFVVFVIALLFRISTLPPVEQKPVNPYPYEPIDIRTSLNHSAIEVRNSGRDRWRDCVVRVAGSTADLVSIPPGAVFSIALADFRPPLDATTAGSGRAVVHCKSR